ncbi:hypothetical protein [Clostridium tagluense]|uniref:Uncharacterized protein n=1 Tax=Clostridium tagluense TaxID=360422 RepID=A0A401USR9_9CLOT|nr:hypothetical protein [Clostridium tagluense]GCD12593.1 hypothetical protein Ctaglu_42160 [Clostridium tagluense]
MDNKFMTFQKWMLITWDADTNNLTKYEESLIENFQDEYGDYLHSLGYKSTSAGIVKF